MFVAVSRYPLALSFALGAGLLSQPALAHSHHHHFSYSRTAYEDARAFRPRHFAVMAAPQGWGADTWQTGSWQPSSPSPQNYWRHGWRGHLARQASFQPIGWQPTGWSQTAWQQNSWQQPTWRRSRFARRQEAASFNGASGYSATYYDYAAQSSWSAGRRFGGRSELSGMIAQAASSAGVPLSLAERVVRRESGGNPRAVHAGNYGLMQIRLGTARSMGYGGSASGLLDPSVNMTYAMRYLAGAYRAAGGNESRAVALYARGYHGTPARVQTYTF
jgi:hypothetical protein